MLKDNVNTSSVFADRLKSSADVVTVTSRSVRSSFASRVSNKETVCLPTSVWLFGTQSPEIKTSKRLHLIFTDN